MTACASTLPNGVTIFGPIDDNIPFSMKFVVCSYVSVPPGRRYFLFKFNIDIFYNKIRCTQFYLDKQERKKRRHSHATTTYHILFIDSNTSSTLKLSWITSLMIHVKWSTFGITTKKLVRWSQTSPNYCWKLQWADFRRNINLCYLFSANHDQSGVSLTVSHFNTFSW